MALSSIPAAYEASTILGAVAVCMAFLLLFYLYAAKKFCLTSATNVISDLSTCCDHDIKHTSSIDNREKVQRDLAASYGYDSKDEGYYDAMDGASSGHGGDAGRQHDMSTDDSDAEMLQRLHRSAPMRYVLRKQASLQSRFSAAGGGRHERQPRQDRTHSLADYRFDRPKLARTTALIRDTAQDLVIRASTSRDNLIRSASPGSTLEQFDAEPLDERCERETPSAANSPTLADSPPPTCATNRPKPMLKSLIRKDMMSQAEKGRIGKLGSSSESTGSADTEEDVAPFLRQRHQAGVNRQSSTNTTTTEDNSRPSTAASDIERPLMASMGRHSVVASTLAAARGPLLASGHYENAAFKLSQESERSGSSPTPGPGPSADMPPRSISRQTTTSSSREQGEPRIRLGTLWVSHSYDPPSRKLQITVIEAKDIPSKERTGAGQVCVRLVLLPHKRQKAKTKSRPTGDNGCPQFIETFTFTRITPEDVLGMGCRFRIYSCQRLRREHLIGEGVLAFSLSRPLQTETRIRIGLGPRSNLSRADSGSLSSLARSDSTGSTHSTQLQHAASPELLLGLAYNGTTGLLSATIIKGSQFRNATMSRAPDTHVKLSLVSTSGAEIAQAKTSIRRGQPNPLFKESFVFQVALFQLPDVTLMVSVYAKRSMKRKKEMLGWFSLGMNSSGEEELAHWTDMREHKGEQVCRWHVLLDS